jgi:glutathione S-transferase
MLELHHLSYSPWSERARWVLEHHGLEYRSRPYTPMIGELPLRFRTGRFRGRITVPVLFTGDGAIADSTDIALYADRIGAGPKLLPGADEPFIREWIARSERALGAGRALVTRRTGESPDALLESVPPALRALGPVGRALGQSGVRFFVEKYGLASHDAADDVRVIAEELDALRAALGSRETLLGSFSYADVVATSVVQVVSPVEHPALKLGPATRAVWETPELRDRYADLVAWRDRTYTRYRPLRGTPRAR